MFKKKDNMILEYVGILQKQIDEVLDIVEDQQKQIERLNENLKLLHELCMKGAEQ